jgi:hypothetical protein
MVKHSSFKTIKTVMKSLEERKRSIRILKSIGHNKDRKRDQALCTIREMRLIVSTLMLNQLKKINKNILKP